MIAKPQPIRIALDAMGGDFAPHNEVAGAIAALRHFVQSGASVELALFGRENLIQLSLSALAKSEKEFLAALPATALTITHCDDVVTMEDDPSSVARKRRGSSLYKGIESHAAGNTHAFVSAGNTGAVMSTGTLVLGRIAGVSRPTIGTFMPTTTNRPVLLVDAGANVDSKARFLYEFAVMGSIYYRQILGIDSPKVGLLNVGEEETKGNEVALEARAMLAEGHQRRALHFVGNVEGRDILIATADVVVCDGFVGNIVLKFAESFLGFLKARFTSFAEASLVNTLLVGAVKPVLTKVLSGMDYQEYGGVPLLGVNGVVIIGHGKSTPLAIKNMILRAEEVVRKRVNETIAEALKA
jgi:glycerol-3-phosphate acyltransferase PlsX